ncbi:phosphotransferase [Pseudofrankia sp. BMG5.37]|uniref:phosphotransferase n=1 Tax=Pseudofrankia sp. BMG5.37 TaxID=3050035 RepID=UPI002893B4E5|nr:phosphotransferase [Pseudofrankia sp. BMG5.37]MDT3442417.1 phosphotransferase [Pseudofrankia sp. BMG5.37]
MDGTPARTTPAGRATSAAGEANGPLAAAPPDATAARTLLDGMAALAARLVGPGGDGGEAVEVISRRHDRLVVRRGGVVLKAHQAGVDPAALAARLLAAADPCLAAALLAPLPVPGAELGGYAARVGGRWVSAWPFGVALGPDDADDAPWEQAAALLARLHTAPCPTGIAALAAHPRRRLAPAVEALRRQAATLPPAAAPAVAGAPKTARPPAAEGAQAAGGVPVSGGSARDAVLAAYRALPDRDAVATARPGRPVTLIHGDWHLGQLVRTDSDGWRLVDIDDLGVGDPAWDLARPAAWFAAGLLPPAVWARFVDTYRAAGGPALSTDGDPWPAVDVPARTLVVEYAARALTASLPTASDGDRDRVGHDVYENSAAGGPRESRRDLGEPDGDRQEGDGRDGDGDGVGPDGLDPLGHAFVTCCRRMLS